MKDKKHLDKLAHLVLYAALVLGAVAIYLVRFDSKKQFIAILFMIGFYLIWGFVYHNLKKDASKKLMVEYLLIASITLLASAFVLIF